MKLGSLLLLSALTAATTAYELKVNYYSDGGCENYVTSLWPGDRDECYDYDYSGTNSALIADCKQYGLCSCTYYSEKGCTGTSKGGGTAVCASNWGVGWKSMKCTGLF
ncbi:hypothetical protein BJY01DRAFT_245643 [Aspergillus pseudoustus]|uniref:Small secreted protein n=1 Tax=Aspergillus pseudoustus TaxID=1810923 RepID=A0ABR4KD13_9EURO